LSRYTLWLNGSSLRRLRGDPEPPSPPPDPLDPYWKNSPKPLAVFMFDEVSDRPTEIVHPGVGAGTRFFDSQCKDVSSQIDIESINGGLEISGPPLHTRAVAVMELQGGPICRFVDKFMIQELQEKWQKGGVAINGPS